MVQSAREGSRHRGVKVFVLLCAVMTIALPAMAAKGGNTGGKGHGGGGSGGSSSCTAGTPRAAADNTYAWASPGSWGMPGQQLKYAIDVINNDVGCGSTSFVVGVLAPNGFSVSSPTSTITLGSASTGYVWASVTSPTVVADGDYPLTITVTRAGASSPSGSSTTYYKVYSSDSVAPTLFWPSPADGATISGSSYPVTVQSTDDHAVEQIDVYVDNVHESTAVCADISYKCQTYYTWPTTPGQHTATFKSHDWMGNVGVLTTTFTVG